MLRKIKIPFPEEDEKKKIIEDVNITKRLHPPLKSILLYF